MKKIVMTVFILPLLLAGCYGENNTPDTDGGDRTTLEPQRENMNGMSDRNTLDEGDDGGAAPEQP